MTSEPETVIPETVIPGDLLQLDSPDTGIATYGYDSGGNRTGQTDARGQASTYGYDARNRLTGVSFTGAPALGVTYQYDTVASACGSGETFALGRLTGIADASGSTSYCYDRFGQVTRKVQVTNGLTFVVRYTYTPSGDLLTLTYPDGTVVDYGRDAQERIAQVGVTGPGASREVLLTGATYAPFGAPTGWSYGNARYLARSLDPDYRAASILDTASGGVDAGFAYDAVGNLQKLHDGALASPPRATLDYDNLNRLMAFRDGPTGTPIGAYTYDATGNRTSFANAAGTQAYLYAPGSHHLASIDAIARGYDAAGNTTSIGGTAKTFTYDATNRLSEVTASSVTLRQYAYNGIGERVRSYLGSSSIYSVYDEAGHWLGDYAGSGSPIQQAVWMDDLPVGLLVGASPAVGRLHYLQPDHLGTPRAVIEPTRDVAVWTWDLKGEAFGDSAPNEDPDGDSISFIFDMRFPGQRYDAASGLNYNYFRDYEPKTGRYVQSDPIGLWKDISTYAYASGNSLGRIDPLGLTSWTGTVHGGSYSNVLGYQKINLRLTSDCALGERVTVDINVSFVIASAGSPAAYTVSRIELRDLNAGAYPEALTGLATFFSASAAAGGGASYGTLTLGDAFSKLSLGGQGGWDASLAMGTGWATIDGTPKRTRCECDK